GPKEARVRLVGLGSGTNAQEIGDGLVAEVRLDRAGADGILRVVYEGTAGTLRAITLADPPRIVLDVARPMDPSSRESREQITPPEDSRAGGGPRRHRVGAPGAAGAKEKSLGARRPPPRGQPRRGPSGPEGPPHPRPRQLLPPPRPDEPPKPPAQRPVRLDPR